jgi:hypothetical protein
MRTRIQKALFLSVGPLCHPWGNNFGLVAAFPPQSHSQNTKDHGFHGWHGYENIYPWDRSAIRGASHLSIKFIRNTNRSFLCGPRRISRHFIATPLRVGKCVLIP